MSNRDLKELRIKTLMTLQTIKNKKKNENNEIIIYQIKNDNDVLQKGNNIIIAVYNICKDEKCTSLLKYYQGNNEDEKKYDNKEDFEKSIDLILSNNKIPFTYQLILIKRKNIF